jgi:hypothetical protein
MASSGMLRRVALVKTDVSEKLKASIIRVTRIGELGTLAVKIPEDAIFHSPRRETSNLIYILVAVETVDTIVPW